MVRKQPTEPTEPLPPPATTLEGREDQLIAATMDLVERRIHDGTASPTETVHFLKAGSVQNKLALDKLRSENEVLKTRVREMESRTDSKDLYDKALKAFRGYAGVDPIDPEGDDYDTDIF